MTEDKTYYSDHTSQITSAQAVFGQNSYPLAEVTSAALGERPANRNTGLILVLIGVVSGFCVATADSTTAGLLTGGFLVVVGLVVAVLAKPRYVVRLVGAAGEVDVLVSSDRDHAHKVVDAINEALENLKMNTEAQQENPDRRNEQRRPIAQVGG
ncbi:MAG: DUF6232 family protein [Chloroflexota bacterium]